MTENVDRSGIYRWKNLITGETYIGSCQNIAKRFYLYFSIGSLKRGTAKNMLISRALLKYGYSNFSLEILEYCDSKVVLEREQYYLDNYRGEYNILSTAGSSKGFKHSNETILRMKSRRHTEESKAIMSAAKRGVNHYMFGKKVSEEVKLKIRLKRGTAIKITDLDTSENNKTFASIGEAAKFLGVDRSYFSKCVKKSSSFILKDRYKIEKL